VKYSNVIHKAKIYRVMGFKAPEDCHSLEEVRNEIDKIDEHIISLFS